MKKIVFIEYVPSVYVFRLARCLKLTGKYETILITFKRPDEKFFMKAYDEIRVMEINHKPNPINLLRLLKKVLSKEWRDFFKDIKNMDPFIFQINGPDLFTMLIINSLREKKKVYFGYDIWAFFEKKLSLEHPGIKEFFQKIFEKKSIMMSQGVLHKGPPGELSFLKYRVTCPDFSLVPGCLDEWIVPSKNKKKQKGEINIVFAGGPIKSWEAGVSFKDIVRDITSQKIHFHTYGPCVNPKDHKWFIDEDKNNEYYHFHASETPENLNKELSKYDFGINPVFYDLNIMNPLLPKTAMANKMFNYIEAGIPIIMNKQFEFMSDIVEKNKIGFAINYEDLKNLREIIDDNNYQEMKRKIKIAQKKYSLNKKLVPKLEKFYEEVSK